ncbi:MULTISPECIES: ABC transporter permease [Pseudomonas]|uniref:ABC transporter permease n=1 Tax=Pseudomonas TaxID=286 RepID=UPI00209F3765|nr:MULTISPECIES: ABC transporter permease [Pseudomonas]MCP1479095.1 sulfonate transport system permease protein [Pseudomonas chlororaphis]MCP1594553.1 sulfonate transport system permease protein [Pseudomonas chlororaphis]WDG53605.1 ABC transporter permease [Pseudomonas chlororaphis]WDH91194.1 ABC transporter permease [Pseudomonas chlororaphis]WPO48957.1 ABC transporter permease [Pseudomonas sp. S1Bt23]
MTADASVPAKHPTASARGLSSPLAKPFKSGKRSTLWGPLILIFIWELSAQIGWLSPKVLAAPSTAVLTGYQLLLNGTLWPHLLASAQRAWLGLGIGVALGLVLALLAGLTRIGDALIDGVVQIKRAVPTLALIPLAILWLGIGDTMKVTLIATSVCLPIYINTHAALKGIDIRYVELAKTLGVGRATFVRRVALPGALPGFFTGLRFSVTLCWGALVVLEQINTTQGIGYLMNRARDYGQTDVIVVGLVIYMILGLASDGLVRLLEARALRYRKVIGS